jgi:hypothetical protein
MKRKLNLALWANLVGKTLSPDGSISETTTAVGYEVRDLPIGEHARIYMAGPVKNPHWLVIGWSDEDAATTWGTQYSSPEAALRALEEDVNAGAKA